MYLVLIKNALIQLKKALIFAKIIMNVNLNTVIIFVKKKLEIKGACLDGLGGKCNDNIYKKDCLEKSENKKDYSYIDSNKKFIKFSKELVINNVFRK